MIKYKSFLWFLLVGSIIFIIYRNWFLFPLILGGDLHYSFSFTSNFLSCYPYAWNYSEQNGFGGLFIAFLGTHYNVCLMSLLAGTFNLPWEVVERITQIFPFLLSILITPYLLKKLLFSKESSLFFFVSLLIYSCNTYILMIVGGGQLLIGLSYALFPVIMSTGIRLFKSITENNIREIRRFAFFSSLIVGLQALIDIRFLYMSLVMLFLGVLFFLRIPILSAKDKVFSTLSKIVLFSSIPFLLIFGVLAYWLMPTLLIHQNPLPSLGSAYTSQNAVEYFSFAKFENTISLLHPNWPENIFGKTYFMRPEFLFLPFLAFSALYFVIKRNSKEETKLVVFFSLLGLVGAFLAKGTNEPFGILYSWLFSHLPGFIMFRDPTKWYVFIALSYSVLIPYTLSQVLSFIVEKKGFSKLSYEITRSIIILLFVVFFLFAIRQAITGNVKGTFAFHQLPTEYARLATHLEQDKNFSRVLWFPMTQPYMYSDPIHPAVSAQDYFKRYTLSQLMTIMQDPTTKKLLKDAGIGYIVVPSDTEKSIYVTDRMYDVSKYTQIKNTVDSLLWLSPISGFNTVRVYKLVDSRPLFYTTSSDVIFQTNNPVSYTITIPESKIDNTLIFLTTYDPQWILRVDNKVITSERRGLYNSFTLEKSGAYTASVEYKTQSLVDIGVIISSISFLLYMIYFVILRRSW